MIATSCTRWCRCEEIVRRMLTVSPPPYVCIVLLYCVFEMKGESKGDERSHRFRIESRGSQLEMQTFSSQELQDDCQVRITESKTEQGTKSHRKTIESCWKTIFTSQSKIAWNKLLSFHVLLLFSWH